MFDLCSKICTALKPQCGINFVRKIFRILEKFLKYNLWKHKNNSIEQYIRETNRNNKQLTSKKYAAQTSDFGCNEQQLTSILTQSDRSNRKCLILEIRYARKGAVGSNPTPSARRDGRPAGASVSSGMLQASNAGCMASYSSRTPNTPPSISAMSSIGTFSPPQSSTARSYSSIFFTGPVALTYAPPVFFSSG